MPGARCVADALRPRTREQGWAGPGQALAQVCTAGALDLRHDESRTGRLRPHRLDFDFPSTA
eukprot:5812224-Pyramimonas_sp.AAC.1